MLLYSVFCIGRKLGNAIELQNSWLLYSLKCFIPKNKKYPQRNTLESFNLLCMPTSLQQEHTTGMHQKEDNNYL